MQITVIGVGNMGSAFVKQLTRAGHQVKITARTPAKAQALAAAHTGVQVVPIANAATGADAVIVATIRTSRGRAAGRG